MLCHSGSSPGGKLQFGLGADKHVCLYHFNSAAVVWTMACIDLIRSKFQGSGTGELHCPPPRNPNTTVQFEMALQCMPAIRFQSCELYIKSKWPPVFIFHFSGAGFNPMYASRGM